MTTNQDPFQTLWDMGYTRLVPVIPPKAPLSTKSFLYKRVEAGKDPRGKVPGVTSESGLWHSYNWTGHDAEQIDIKRWSAMKAGVGIKTGHGLIMIDADTHNAEYAEIIKQEIIKRFGILPTRIGQAPKAGYIARISEDFPYARIDFNETERVEILTEGRFFVAYGIHPNTNKPYHYPNKLPNFNDLPIVTGQQITDLLETLRNQLPAPSPVIREGATTQVEQSSLMGDKDLITKAVKATPNTSANFPTRESYRDFGYAIKASLPNDEPLALPLFKDWAARWEDGTNEESVVEADFKRMKPPFRRGASWLYQVAESTSNNQFSAASQWFEEIEHEELFPQPATKPKTKYTLTFADDEADKAISDMNAPLIKGLIDQKAMTILYGESNSGKTFVALDIAYHIATGKDWGGMKTNQGAVIYIAAEGGSGVRQRLAAMKEKYGKAGENFRTLLTTVDLLHKDADLKPLIDAITESGIHPSLIVVDTLSRAMAGGDENSSTDMGQMVTHLDILRIATQSHVLVVHHSGKDRAKGARGHSLLRAATDTEIEVADSNISVTKQRDLPKDWTSAFTLDVTTIGKDVDGDDVTSCTLRLISATEAAQEAQIPVEGVSLTVKEIEVIQIITTLEERSQDGGCNADEILAMMGEDKKDKKRLEALRYTLKQLKAKRIVQHHSRNRWKRNPNWKLPEPEPEVGIETEKSASLFD